MELNALLQTLQTALPEEDKKALESQLCGHINYLINNDFQRLVQVLYTVDVDEKKLKNLLALQPDKDAAEIIASLIINRQLEKSATRQHFKTDMAGDDEDEKW